jgi:RecG-like helicase
MNDISEFNKLCINYLRDNKIDMSQYTELLNIDIFNVKKVCDYVNNLDNNFKDMFYNHYKNLIKYKDNKLIFKNKILLQRLLELAQQNNFNFTKNQTEIINELIRFMTDNTQKYYGLFGYAGTGKTTSLVALITYMLELKYVKSIIFTSPTNKALNVIKNKFINSLRYLLEKHNIEYAETKTFDDNIDKLRKHNINIEFSTIHKLLNYKTEFNQNGEMVFIKEKDSDLKKYDIIIIDESSMVSINLIYDIIKDTDKINTKIIFAGDPAQLPPVNEHISSIFMNENTKISHLKMTKYIPNLSESNYIKFCETIINMNKFTLNEIIRTKNPSIIDSCNTIRNWIQNRSEFTDIQKYEDTNIILYPNDKTKKTKTLWYKKFEHKILDENDTIIISWTNGETDMYNNYYRNTLFNSNKSIDVFMEGDILILNEFYNINCNKFNTSEKIVVIEVKQDIFNIENLDNKINKAVRILKNARSIETRFKNFIENINKNKNSIPIYKLKVKKIDEPDKTYDINVIRKESLEYHKELMFNVSDSIRTFRNNIIDVTTNESLEYNLIQPLWKDFNNKYIDPFATVSYGYAITCHKAQGSNYKNVFVDFSDIVKNKNEEEMKRCMYTAMSRTIDTLHILI